MEEMIKSPLDLFADVQETYEEALQKSADESKSFTKTKHFRMDSVGTYSVRILPLAPTKQSDGTYKLDRKGYEYPTKTQLLKLTNPNSKSKKDQNFYVTVTHANYVGLSVDLIDTYIQVAEEKYGDDEKLMKKINGSGFEGGLKWSSQRAMYVFDTNKKDEGIQLLTLSYSQYKDLEDRKIAVWNKLRNKDPKTFCPISSIKGAYPVEISRKEENRKITYTFNVDVLANTMPLSEAELQSLLDTPRIPEVLYRYSRFHLEATIEFLKQYDEKNEMDVMSSKAITEAIEKIKMELPADDKSHFSFDKKDHEDGEGSSEEATIDTLWKRWEDLNERGIGDKSDEGQELRDDIRAFIDDNDLHVRVVRGKSNQDLLEAIEDALEAVKSGDEDEEDEQEDHISSTPEPESEPAPEPEEEEDEEESAAPARGEHNDDTNEPAVGSRRSARPTRRRPR
jgi:hypothetical protein